MEQQTLTKEVIARKFALGQILDVELHDGLRSRFQTQLIGMREGRYLVAEQPSLTRYGNLREQLVENQPLIIRTICEKTTGEALGFRAQIFAKTSRPDSLLFISYPVDAKSIDLRSEKRMLVTVKARLCKQKDGEGVDGMLIDLSRSGCRYESDQPDLVKVERDDIVWLQYEHPVSHEAMNVSVQVRSLRIQHGIISVGMAFEK